MTEVYLVRWLSLDLYLSQCWTSFMSPYGVTRPQWVNSYFDCHNLKKTDHIILELLCIPLYPSFVPESPRWLFARGKSKEGWRVLRTIAVGNGKDLSEDCIPLLVSATEEDGDDGKGSVRCCELFHSSSMAWRTIALCSIWFVYISVFHSKIASSSKICLNVSKCSHSVA